MSPSDWAAIAVSVTTLIGAAAMGVRHLVKHYLSELRPNGGSSLRDSVDRLERQVEEIISIVFLEVEQPDCIISLLRFLQQNKERVIKKAFISL